MTNEERDIITRYVERVSGAQGPTAFNVQSGNARPGQTTPQVLPPVDREADALIGELFGKYPEARYRMTQTSFVQEQALAQAASKVQALQAELDRTKQDLAQAQQGGQRQGGGFFSNLFGGGQSRPAQGPAQSGPWGPGAAAPSGYAPPPQYAPQYAPGFQPQMFQGGGSGFLGSALSTAAGVAGGVVLGDALANMFSPHGGGGLFGGGGYGGTTVIEQPIVEGGAWAGGAPGGQPVAPPDGGYVDQGTWNTDAGGAPPSDQGGWTDTASSGGDGGGWTDNSGGGSDGGGWSDSGGGGGGNDDFI